MQKRHCHFTALLAPATLIIRSESAMCTSCGWLCRPSLQSAAPAERAPAGACSGGPSAAAAWYTGERALLLGQVRV